MTMTSVDDFLAEVLPQLIAADTALHDGDPSQRIGMWSHEDPVTLFGAATTKLGWDDIGKTFEWLGTRFSDCTSFDYEVLAAGVSGDLAYLAGIEHTTTAVGDEPPATYTLRVTTVLRREDGRWRVVHRHGDPFDSDTEAVVARL